MSLRVPQGQIVAVIGPNGAGKSTLLRAICGFLPPRRGCVRYCERLLTGVPPYRMVELGISYLPQERTVFPHLSVEQNLRLGGWHFRRDRRRLQQAVERVLGLFPMLAARRRSKAGDLSGGLQKILEIARGLVPEPQLLVVDEPSVGLAPMVAREIYEILQRLRAQRLTVLLVDQNVRAAVALADYVYVLELGRNRAEGSRQAFAGDLQATIKAWLQI
ncbi:MAG: ABC transporter ATP-binding protein [Candidatus Tectimicrobiota bacterium]|nr:MAG: ABC transporter ATP-binding protein [Candidatus Tectomicrobia bacterium]